MLYRRDILSTAGVDLFIKDYLSVYLFLGYGCNGHYFIMLDTFWIPRRISSDYNTCKIATDHTNLFFVTVTIYLPSKKLLSTCDLKKTPCNFHLMVLLSWFSKNVSVYIKPRYVHCLEHYAIQCKDALIPNYLINLPKSVYVSFKIGNWIHFENLKAGTFCNINSPSLPQFPSAAWLESSPPIRFLMLKALLFLADVTSPGVTSHASVPFTPSRHSIPLNGPAAPSPSRRVVRSIFSSICTILVLRRLSIGHLIHCSLSDQCRVVGFDIILNLSSKILVCIVSVKYRVKAGLFFSHKSFWSLVPFSLAINKALLTPATSWPHQKPAILGTERGAVFAEIRDVRERRATWPRRRRRLALTTLPLLAHTALLRGGRGLSLRQRPPFIRRSAPREGLTSNTL